MHSALVGSPISPVMASAASLYTARTMAVLEKDGLIAPGQTVPELLTEPDLSPVLNSDLLDQVIPAEISTSARDYWSVSPPRALQRLRFLLHQGAAELIESPMSWAAVAALETRIVALEGDPPDHPLRLFEALKRWWHPVEPGLLRNATDIILIARDMSRAGMQTRSQQLFRDLMTTLRRETDRTTAIGLFWKIASVITEVDDGPWVEATRNELAQIGQTLFSQPYISRQVIAQLLQNKNRPDLAAHYYQESADHIRRWERHDNPGRRMIELAERLLAFETDDWVGAVRSITFPILDQIEDEDLRYRILSRLAVHINEWAVPNESSLELVPDVLTRTEDLGDTWHRYEIYETIQQVLLRGGSEVKAYEIVRRLEQEHPAHELISVKPAVEIISRYEIFRYAQHRLAGVVYLEDVFHATDNPQEQVKIASAVGRLGAADRSLALFGRLTKRISQINLEQTTVPTAEFLARQAWHLKNEGETRSLRGHAISAVADGLAKANLGFQSALLFRRLHILALEISDKTDRAKTLFDISDAVRHAGLVR